MLAIVGFVIGVLVGAFASVVMFLLITGIRVLLRVWDEAMELLPVTDATRYDICSPSGQGESR